MIPKIAILSSGNGSNAENLVLYSKNAKTFEIALIISNKESAFVHERAKKLGITSFTFPKSEFEEGNKILELLTKNSIDGVILAGFLLRIPPVILQAYPDRIINIHPSLLPKYGGKGMYGMNVHQAVKEANEQETGITIHYVNENYDEGNIIFQAKFAILSSDTPESIASKVHELEYKHFPKVSETVFVNKK